MDVAGHLAGGRREDGTLPFGALLQVVPVIVGVLAHRLQMDGDPVQLLETLVVQRDGVEGQFLEAVLGLVGGGEDVDLGGVVLFPAVVQAGPLEIADFPAVGLVFVESAQVAVVLPGLLEGPAEVVGSVAVHAQADPEFLELRMGAVAEGVDGRGRADLQPVRFKAFGHGSLEEHVEMQAVALMGVQLRGVELQHASGRGGIVRTAMVTGADGIVGRAAFHPGAVFPLDIAAGLDGPERVFVGVLALERPDVTQVNGRFPADLDVALDHEGPFAVLGQVDLVREDAGGGGGQRGGQRQQAEQVSRIHQKIRLRLIYGMG